MLRQEPSSKRLTLLESIGCGCIILVTCVVLLVSLGAVKGLGNPHPSEVEKAEIRRRQLLEGSTPRIEAKSTPPAVNEVR